MTKNPSWTSGRVPLISFAHGFGNGGDVLDERNRERIFTPLVQEGFFVIAYQHNGFCDTPNNQMGAIEWLKTSEYASMIDFSNVGVTGFSLGGVASWKSTKEGNPDVKAAVSISAYCGFFGNNCPVPELPTLMLTGSADTTSPASKQRARFNQMSGPGMFVETPMPHSFNTFWAVTAMQPLMIGMFRCYLLSHQEACSQLNERGPLEDTCFGTTSWRSVVGPEEAGLSSDAAGAEPTSDKPAGIPNSNAVWTVPRRETEFDTAGPYPEIVRCRQELAASFPGSLWRNSTTPKYQMEAVLDIPADLKWNGTTNRCSSPYRVNVYYPVGASGRVPLISYAHGFGNGGDVLDERNRERIFTPLVQEGFFVIAYQHNGFCDTPNNQMGAIEWLKTSEYASMIDFSNVGVTGFSLGGVASWKSTKEGNPDVKAAVSISAYCGFFGNNCPVPELPTLMLTGSADTTSPASKQRARFNQMSAPGLLVETPMPHSFNTFWSVEAMQPLMKSMFHCYLRDDQEACSQLNERGPLQDTCFGTTSWRSVLGNAASAIAPGEASM